MQRVTLYSAGMSSGISPLHQPTFTIDAPALGSQGGRVALRDWKRSAVHAQRLELKEAMGSKHTTSRKPWAF